LLMTAVNVTVVPAQIVFDEADIVTEGGVTGLMIIVTPLLVAVGTVAQAELEVNTQVTISLLLRVLSVKLLAFVPTLTPFFFH